jgi:uncharacterized protein YfaS (alpha-2-macroglobulin family)
MLFFQWKIRKSRKFNELLERKNLPADLQELKTAIKNTAPLSARAAFQKDLKNQLLLKHQQLLQIKGKSEHAPEKNSFNLLKQLRGWPLALTVLVLVSVSAVLSYPFIPAPRVDGYTLKGGIRKISSNAPIKIVFTQPMDRKSVENAFRIEPHIEGEFGWMNNTLLFKPKEKFQVGQTFKVSLTQEARSMLQKHLPYAYLETFEIIGPPQVLLFSPEDKLKDVPIDAQITVHFDRPMIQLTTLDQSEKVMPFQIEPKLEGKAKWLGTDTVRFIPTNLAYASHYTIKIPKGTISLDGGQTEQDFSYGFDTLKPQLVATGPYNGNINNGPETKVKLTFNQEMDLSQANSLIHLWKYKGNFDDLLRTPDKKKKDWKNSIAEYGDLGSFLPLDLSPYTQNTFDKSKWEAAPFVASYYTLEQYKKDNPGDVPKEGVMIDDEILPEASELRKNLVLSPQQWLAPDSIYLVTVDKTFKGKEGTLKLDEGKAIFFKTVGDIFLVFSSPAENATNFSENPRFHFSQSMDPESFKGKVVIEPKSVDEDTKKEKEINFSASEQNTLVQINYDFKPSTKYTIKILPGIKDLFGNTFNKELLLHFKTAPLKPDFTVMTAPDLSVLDSKEPTVFYVKGANIDHINVNFKKLSEEEFEKTYSRGYIDMNQLPQGPFTSWKKPIKKQLDKEVIEKIDFAKESKSSVTPGYYYFEVSNPEVINYNGQPRIFRHVFMVSSSALTVKMSQNKMLVWATSLADGTPLEGMEISVKDPRKKLSDPESENKETDIAFKGTTSKEGLVSFDFPQKDSINMEGYMVTGKKGDDFAMTHTTWTEGIQPWNFDIEYNPTPATYYAYIYNDRPIYRPGHTVYFKGLVRMDKDAAFKLPDFKTVHVTISGQGEKVYEKDLSLNANGTFNGEMKLSEKVRGGEYFIEVTLPKQGASLETFQQYFRVAEYRKPEYELTLEADKKSYVNQKTAKITIKGGYFFGAPLPNAPIQWTLMSKDYFFFLGPDSKGPYASDWYSFSDEGYGCYYGCTGETKVVSQGKAKLNANGEYVLNLPLNITDRKLSQIYTLEVTAFDLNNQSVSNRINMPVHQGEYYVGIMNRDQITEAGKEARFQVITVNESGEPVKNKKVDVSFFKRNWNTVQKKNVDGEFYYENSYEDTLLEKKTVTTDGKGYAEVAFVPKEGGIFKASAESKDSKNNVIRAATNVYASSGTFVNWGRENNDRIELIPDKQEYKPGDTAHLLIKSPYQNVYALVTHERGDILYKKVIRITSNSHTIEVPISENSLPNVFVSVLLVKGSKNKAGLSEPSKNQVDERSHAAFKIGYATLHVDTSSKELKIDVKPDKAKYHPGEEVTLKVNTQDANGKAVKAELSLSVVDKSVLSLTENFTADLLKEFYRKRFLGVMTSQTLTKALSRINVQVESGLKGGGGALAKKRGEFKDTAYWQATVNTDANGRGEVKFKLPDNLTTWQILAIGITPDTRVGSQKVDFQVSKDILIRPVLPRFLIIKDQMTVGAIVHNYRDKGLDIDVSLEAGGVKLDQATKKRIHLNPGEEQKVDFPLTVLAEKEAKFTFKALAAGDPSIGDILEEKLPIQIFSFPEVVATSAIIADDTKHVETIWLPSSIDQKFGELTLTVAPTLFGSFGKGIEYLVQFPYGCAEQIASSLLPNLALKQMINLPSIGEKVSKQINLKDLQKNTETGVQALYKIQQSSGAWGLFETSETNPYLTAYVLFTLHQAQKAGYTVDQKVMDKATGYLKNYLNQKLPDSSKNESQPKTVSGPSPNTHAYALYVLAEMNKGDLALSNNLYEKRKNLSLFSKAYLAMAFQLLTTQEKLQGASREDVLKKIENLKGEILVLAKENPRDAHFEQQNFDFYAFDTNTRTTAIVLQMLTRVQPENPLIPKILRYLLAQRKDGHYASTQETAISLLAFMDYLRTSNELEPDFDGIVTVNNDNKLQKTFSKKDFDQKESVTIPVSELLLNNVDNEITATRSGQGKMYFDMNLKYYLPTEQIQPRDEGIAVHQEYFKVDDKKNENPVTSVQIGENLKGKILVMVPEDRHYVMVEDFLPAGLEGIDFSLKTSEQNLKEKFTQGSCTSWKCFENFWRFNHSEVRDDRMMFFADFLPKGVYEIEYFVRATTPGTFHDLPTMASETYFPEVFGRSEGKSFVVEGTKINN